MGAAVNEKYPFVYRYNWKVFNITFVSCYEHIWSRLFCYVALLGLYMRVKNILCVCVCKNSVKRPSNNNQHPKSSITQHAQFVAMYSVWMLCCTYHHDQWDRQHPYIIHLQSQSVCLFTYVCVCILCTCTCIWFVFDFVLVCRKSPKIHIFYEFIS